MKWVTFCPHGDSTRAMAGFSPAVTVGIARFRLVPSGQPRYSNRAVCRTVQMANRTAYIQCRDSINLSYQLCTLDF